MTATITDLAAWRRDHAIRQCNAISLAEALTLYTLRWWAATARDQLRYWWHV